MQAAPRAGFLHTQQTAVLRLVQTALPTHRFAATHNCVHRLLAQKLHLRHSLWTHTSARVQANDAVPLAPPPQPQQEQR